MSARNFALITTCQNPNVRFHTNQSIAVKRARSYNEPIGLSIVETINI